MAPEQVLQSLLESTHEDETLDHNRDLLKKFLLVVALGWFRINNQAPDNQVSLAHYLLDNERVMFDLTRLDEEHRTRFRQWLLEAHTGDANLFYPGDVATNEYRGYTAEVQLSLWGKIRNFLFLGRRMSHWRLAPMAITLDYQLTGLEMYEGEYGFLFGFSQHQANTGGDKYHDPADDQQEPLGNTKRVHVTNHLVDKLVRVPAGQYDFARMVESPHLFSVPVSDRNARYRAMRAYRQSEFFLAPKPWYARLWSWFTGLFRRRRPTVNAPVPTAFESVHTGETFEVLQDPVTRTLAVTEMRPSAECVVFSGGGAKLFAHIGAMQAFHARGIYPSRFAGSSAGAIQGLLCYLGYSMEEILLQFRDFRQDVLVHYDPDRQGISDACALKTALDFFIQQKLQAMIESYGLMHTQEGRKFLRDSGLSHGRVTFGALAAFKERYPDCGLGNELVVTSTNHAQRSTRYYSAIHSPDFEVSEAVKISASFPVVYKPTILDGEIHGDGGVLNNLPTEVFSDDGATLLEAEYGKSLRVVVLQFDNGVEQHILHRLGERVYRESWIANRIYQFLTGVQDPASAWERDRIKLRQHAMQTILIPVGNVSATQFNLSEEARQRLVRSGYDAACAYLDARGIGKRREHELLYATFSGMEELLAYCCYRNQPELFSQLAVVAKAQGMDHAQILGMQTQYFPSDNNEDTDDLPDTDIPTAWLPRSPLRFFNKTPWFETVPAEPAKFSILFTALYPVLLALPDVFYSHAKDRERYQRARHHFSIGDPFRILEGLRAESGPVHILIPLLEWVVSSYRDVSNPRMACQLSQILAAIRCSQALSPGLFGYWELGPEQCADLLEHLCQSEYSLLQIAAFARSRDIPSPAASSTMVLAVPDSDEDSDSDLSDNHVFGFVGHGG